MRENIGLYRGKRIDNDEWAIGNLLVFPDLTSYICCPDADDSETLNKYPVDPETVGECTNLPDKNGMEIFEGDILALNKWKPYYVVKFEDGTFCMVGTAIPIRHANKFEIIGNIYDNPELVKGAADE